MLKKSITNSLRHSAYLCTPSGNPKLALWLSLSVLNLFSNSPEKVNVKKSITNSRCHSAYLCTPLGNPKLALWLSLSVLNLFFNSPEEVNVNQKTGDFFEKTHKKL